jgi:hypothetical protein
VNSNGIIRPKAAMPWMAALLCQVGQKRQSRPSPWNKVVELAQLHGVPCTPTAWVPRTALLRRCQRRGFTGSTPSGGISSASTRMKIGGRRARLGRGSHQGGLAVVSQQFGEKPVAFDGGECHTVVGGKLGKLLQLG